MYMPSLIPRDIHHLWIQKDGQAIKKKEGQRNNQLRNPFLNDDQTHRRRPHFAPPLSAYSSDRPGTMYSQGANSLDINDPMFDIEVRMDALRSLRSLGHDYLAPIGIDRTQKAIDEEREMRRQMEEQHRSEVPTAENLMGEGEAVEEEEDVIAIDELEQEEQQQQQQQQPGNNVIEEEEEIRGESGGEQQQQGDQQNEDTQPTEEVNLDDDIPEAEENSYDHIYDEADEPEDRDVMYEGDSAFERQYDEGFMVSEEYQEVDSAEEEIRTVDTPRIEERYQRFMRHDFQTPNSTSTSNTNGGNNTANENSGNANSSFINDNNINRGNVSISSNFSHSNIQHDTFNDTTTSTHPGDVSVNESDLDMVIDDE
ncbi:Midasin [Wickerhamomyces ciferrii]|uniref:Midasin n=1 Tax=Wickerhamomyces ciferrii (strain ATCC 14091 / BCRC 22168 / CBS 111 / JCM 3599 / NBRC 0793 / NRRL Y-1031 F-60-10) TaxID=1206466 RepID=K0KCV7_WICCF|nr:Midasin [Wickerhamomyces ciferrii]CCH42935.1 Midasin [Wickerhamomyces ciferrii]